MYKNFKKNNIKYKYTVNLHINKYKKEKILCLYIGNITYVNKNFIKIIWVKKKGINIS